MKYLKNIKNHFYIDLVEVNKINSDDVLNDITDKVKICDFIIVGHSNQGIKLIRLITLIIK